MGGTSTTTQNQQQQSQLTPYAPAQAGLNGILGGIQGLIPGAGGNAQTAGAFDQLYANAAKGNPYAPAVGDVAAGQLAGSQNYGAATGMMKDAYGNLQSQLSPFTSGNPFDPSSNPALRQQLDTVNADVSGQVNPMFAAAGRLASPDNAQALARGITQGSTGILQNAATNRLNASNALYGAGQGTAGGLLGADAANTATQNSGVSNAGAALAANNYGPQQALQTWMAQQGMPAQNLAQLSGILGPLAGMFGQQQGTGSSTGTSTMSPMQQAMGFTQMFGNLFGGQGGGAAGNAMKFFGG